MKKEQSILDQFNFKKYVLKVYYVAKVRFWL